MVFLVLSEWATLAVILQKTTTVVGVICQYEKDSDFECDLEKGYPDSSFDWCNFKVLNNI